MATLPVITYPSPLLKKKSVDVKEFNSRLVDLVQDMFATMKVENGIGLAAPQIGENINLFVMDVGQEDPVNPKNVIANPVCLINPKILQSDGSIIYEEGCLSCPELLVKVDRKKNIQVAFFDAEGRPQTIGFSELEAVCVQHEMDHLKGILLVDHISQMKRENYARERIRIRKNENDTGSV